MNTVRAMGCAPTRPELLALLSDNAAKVRAMTSEQAEEMCSAQGKSWARAEAGKEDL